MFPKFLKNFDQQKYLNHLKWQDYALRLAAEALKAGEVPVGAVIVDDQDNLIAQGINRKQRTNDPTAHAEIIALRQASRQLNSWRLENCTLYVTLEPCPMCAGAIIQSRLGLLVYGIDDPKTGAIRTALNLPDSQASNHRLQVLAGVREILCREQLTAWFKQQRMNR